MVSYHLDIRKRPTRKRAEVFVERSIFTTIINALRDVQDDVDNSRGCEFYFYDRLLAVLLVVFYSGGE